MSILYLGLSKVGKVYLCQNFFNQSPFLTMYKCLCTLT